MYAEIKRINVNFTLILLDKTKFIYVETVYVIAHLFYLNRILRKRLQENLASTVQKLAHFLPLLSYLYKTLFNIHIDSRFRDDIKLLSRSLAFKLLSRLRRRTIPFDE